MLLLLGESLAWDFESRSRSRHLAKSNKVVKFVLGAISQRWNDSDRIFWGVVNAIHEMACRRDGECCKRINVCDVMKQFAKVWATPSENIHIGTTVRYDLFLKVEHIIAFFLHRVPCHKRFSIFWIHPVWVVVGCG